ncbi:ATP phosphoribosyltransferase regulatory subunit [Aminipila sp.]|uniref:ATP phosphoribosyltransferase regulatory subunit n=1 Tax=Aminipila sp. TaxID=2060095 RepID=UPI002899267F|nr:ATP phosphoribosyltransferase regulatory subunit [Aminipila sp.]
MKNLSDVLTEEEKATLKLRTLYQGYGYSQFNMNKFEEYDLYVRNKDFLASDNVITFTDTNGKLMALKPDVTLSIIKNSKDTDDSLQKLYYIENIYRVSKETHTYKEILQTGLECIGKIDCYHMSEVIMLACKSLQSISSSYLLDISHMGMITVLIEELNLSSHEKKLILKYIGERNLDGIKKACDAHSGNEAICKVLITVLSSYGPMDTVIPVLTELCINGTMKLYIKELEEIFEILKENHLKNIQLDFSIVNGMNYYSGIVFQGFISGIPSAFLSGGRYDKLMQKMGKDSGAIGFAVYLDLIQHLSPPPKAYDVDALLLYDENSDPKQLTKAVQEWNGTGQSIQVQPTVPKGLKYKKLLQIKDGRLEIVDSDD